MGTVLGITASTAREGELPEITLSNDRKYRGELSPAGKPHGRGRLRSSNGVVYEGSFKDGLIEGLGVHIWPTGPRYEGECVKGDFTGLGAQWNKDGKLTHCGRWANDKLVETRAVPLRCFLEGKCLSAAAAHAKREHPIGSALMPDGTHYIGELNEAGQPHGQGASFHPDGAAYLIPLVDAADAIHSGRWVNGKLEGRATQTFVSGDRYDGTIKNSQREGVGVYSWKISGNIYEGEFAAHKRSGLGAQWDKEGKLTHCGRWDDVNLIKSCAVPLRFIPEGKHLSEAARQAKRDHPDRSALLWDGTHYIGSLDDRGQPHGQGASFYPDGSPEITLLVDHADASNSGRWVDGQLQGRAMQLYDDGGRSTGSFMDGFREGRGVYIWKDSERYEGEFVGGNRNGRGAQWNSSKQLMRCGRWLGDKLVLSCPVPMRCIPDGEHLSAAAKADRQSHPDTTLLLPSGGHYTGNFTADTLRMHGVGVEFDSAGVETRRGEWCEGTFHSGSGLLLSSDGQCRYIGLVRNGRKHGRGTLTDLRSGAVVEAEWSDGVTAAGAYTAADGSLFEGELSLESRLPHGSGVRRTAQGTIEVGEFAEGVLVRSCAVLCSKLSIRTLVPPTAHLFYPDRSWYTGSLNDAGRPEGVGVKFDAAGAELCNGQWHEGDFTKGKMRCADGLYEGPARNGRRHGWGKVTLPSGAVIDAEWREDTMAAAGVTLRSFVDSVAESSAVPPSPSVAHSQTSWILTGDEDGRGEKEIQSEVDEVEKPEDAPAVLTACSIQSASSSFPLFLTESERQLHVANGQAMLAIIADRFRLQPRIVESAQSLLEQYLRQGLGCGYSRHVRSVIDGLLAEVPLGRQAPLPIAEAVGQLGGNVEAPASAGDAAELVAPPPDDGQGRGDDEDGEERKEPPAPPAVIVFNPLVTFCSIPGCGVRSLVWCAACDLSLCRSHFIERHRDFQVRMRHLDDEMRETWHMLCGSRIAREERDEIERCMQAERARLTPMMERVQKELQPRLDRLQRTEAQLSRDSPARALLDVAGRHAATAMAAIHSFAHQCGLLQLDRPATAQERTLLTAEGLYISACNAIADWEQAWINFRDNPHTAALPPAQWTSIPADFVQLRNMRSELQHRRDRQAAAGRDQCACVGCTEQTDGDFLCGCATPQALCWVHQDHCTADECAVVKWKRSKQQAAANAQVGAGCQMMIPGQGAGAPDEPCGDEAPLRCECGLQLCGQHAGEHVRQCPRRFG